MLIEFGKARRSRSRSMLCRELYLAFATNFLPRRQGDVLLLSCHPPETPGPIRASVILVCRNGASARGRKGLRLSQRNLLAQWISLARLTRQLASHATAQPNDLSRR